MIFEIYVYACASIPKQLGVKIVVGFWGSSVIWVFIPILKFLKILSCLPIDKSLFVQTH